MKRVGVVGGGVIGLTTAYYLEKRGALPIIFEASDVGAGCSAGNAGWVCPSISTPLAKPGLDLGNLAKMMRPGGPLYIKPSASLSLRPWLARFKAHCTQANYDRGVQALAALNAETKTRYAELLADDVDVHYAEQGLLMAFRDPELMAEALKGVEAAAALGRADFDVLEREELRSREPLLRSTFTSGIFVTTDAHVRAETLTRGLVEALRQRNVEIREQDPVTGFEWNGDRVQSVVTNKSKVLVDDVVLAAGAETGPLAAAAGLSLPLTAGKGYSVTIDAPKGMPKQPLYLVESKVAITPFEGSLRLSGGMEFSGINRQVRARGLKAIRRAAHRDLDLPEALEEGTEWVGMRPIVPDTLPVIGQVPGRGNVYLSSGHQMLGITLAPSSGDALSQLIVEGQSSIDLTPFSPARF
ncbi:MAG: NAD(P)/FAD-dependent oxidoreductase [Longimicrobiales bacterium]